MRKLIIPLAALTLALAGCVTPQQRSSGTGTVVSLVKDPAEYYTASECARKFSKARCLVPVMKEPEEYELSYTDAGSGKVREVEVPAFIFDACQEGNFFDGDSCIALTPSPAVS